jgi:BASS family bile acid:Na+ symporter
VDDVLEAAYLAGAVVALWAAGLELGLREPLGALVAPLRRARLLARISLVDVVFLPLLVWALVQLADVPAGYATGLLLVGVASAGPLAVKAAQLARADAATALSLVVLLELVNLAAIPVWAALILPAGTNLEVQPVLVTLVALIVLPLAAGVACRRLAPQLVARLGHLLPRVANVGLVVAVGAVVTRDAEVVWDALGERVPLVAAAAVLVALLLGWLAGGPEPESRAAAALVTGIRANALALAIAASSFPGRQDVRAGVVVFALFSITVPLCAAVVLGRRRLVVASLA